jgi:hypothetical protein
MGGQINTPLTGDIWHLNIDDLLLPLPETQRLGGLGPFVINLSASSAPIDVPAKSIDGCEHVHIFLVQRIEDRRPRYRLRLGPFVTEDEAEASLHKVRTIYPSALTATADAEDLRAMTAMRAKFEAPPAPVSSPIAAPPAVKTAAMPAAKAPAVLLDATQTVRALTQLELEDEQASHWFVIQLALADDPFDPDVLPNLDIFGAYRLYSVAGIDQGRIVHALRMGFFSEETGARAVASYLAAYYDNPSIKRVSSAERERFADQRLEPRKDVGATGRQAVIEITNERFVRERKSTASIAPKSR